MNLKSNPSEPAFEINATLTLYPSLLLSFVIAFTSASLLGDILLSPVIIIYFAGIIFAPPALSFGFIVFTFTGRVGAVLNNDLPDSPYLVNPISSNASAIGINPPSMY